MSVPHHEEANYQSEADQDFNFVGHQRCPFIPAIMTIFRATVSKGYVRLFEALRVRRSSTQISAMTEHMLPRRRKEQANRESLKQDMAHAI
jgi:hypothetical protein